MARLRGMALATCGAAMMMLGSAASAHRGPPGTLLRVAHTRGFERGKLYRFDWTRRSGKRTCVTASADGPRRFGRPLLIEPGTQTATVVFRTRKRPRSLQLNAWRAVDPTGAPLGPPETIPYALAARRRHGKVARWRARFTVSLFIGDYYIDVFGVWRNTNGCGGAGDADWTFHLGAAAPLPSVNGRGRRPR